jgi:hypothetical protein
MNKAYVVPLVFGGLVGATAVAGAVILAVSLDGHAGAGAAIELVPGVRPAYAGRPAPARLVGKWSSSRLSMINYRDRYSGSFAPPSGSIFSYTIAADGTFEFSGYMQSSFYHCTIVIFRWQRGTLVADGQSLTLTPREGRQHYKDSCRAGSEKEKSAVDEPARYSFTIETEGAHTVLVMKKANGEDWGRFYRK